MREHELKLNELNMSPGRLSQTARQISALVGIEFEMHVPGYQADATPEEDTSEDYRPSSISDISSFFEPAYSRSGLARLERELNNDWEDWLSDQLEDAWSTDGDDYIDQWCKNNLRDHSDEEIQQEIAKARDKQGLYFKIRDEFNDEYSANAWSEEDWIHDNEWDSMMDVAVHFSFEWPYWTDPDSSPETSLEGIADSISNFIKKSVYVNYHGYDYWKVTTDSSLDKPGYVGVELISPPIQLNNIAETIASIQRWGSQVDAVTDHQTGLHINVSLPGNPIKDLDYVKLVLLLGDQWVLNQFNRQANKYCESALAKLHDRAWINFDESALLAILDTIKKGLGTMASTTFARINDSKYTSINIKSTHVEFRSPGGDWLNQDLQMLVNTINRFVVALDAAMDPTKYKEEYLKKFYMLLNPNRGTNDTILYFAKYSAGQMTRRDLKSLLGMIRDSRRPPQTPAGDHPEYTPGGEAMRQAMSDQDRI